VIDLNEITARLTDIINDAALLFAHEPDDALVKALKRMRIELRAEYGSLLHDAPETNALVEEVLTCIAIQRHDIELAAGLPPTARTMH
jgi:hypothetical protein